MDAHCAVALAITEIVKGVHKSAKKMQTPESPAQSAQHSDVLGSLKTQTMLGVVSHMKNATKNCWKVFDHLSEKANLIHEEILLQRSSRPRGGPTMRQLQSQLSERLSDKHFMALQKVRRQHASPRSEFQGPALHGGSGHVQRSVPISRAHSREYLRDCTIQQSLPPTDGQRTQRNHGGRPLENRRNLQPCSSSSSICRGEDEQVQQSASPLSDCEKHEQDPKQRTPNFKKSPSLEDLEQEEYRSTFK